MQDTNTGTGQGPSQRTTYEYREREPFALLWTWWQGDEKPQQTEVSNGANVTFQQTTNRDLMRKLMLLTPADITHRLKAGHRAYLATIEDKTVAYGWSAGREAAFGSPTTFFQIPPGNRYLYHFVTFLPWRGQGLYPRLLQSIIDSESNENERFWIIHRQSNRASQHGIARASFHLAGRIYDMPRGKRILVGANQPRTQAGATLLGLPFIQEQA